MSHQIIGLTGPAGSGKDAVRDILEDLGFIGFAFADPIRSMIRKLLARNGLSEAWMDKRDLKERVIPELNVSYRQMAQTLGTEWGRSLRPDFWLSIADAYMEDLVAQEDSPQFVVSDVRFVNEAQWVRERDGVIWRINRPDLAAVRAHVSESEMDSLAPEVVIHNNGTLDDLRAIVLEQLGLAA